MQVSISCSLGLFTTVGDIFTLLHRLMFAGPSDPWINSTTVHTFTTVSLISESSAEIKAVVH